MRILIAEDDDMSRQLLEVRLTEWGYEVISVEDGNRAWEILQQEDTPRLAILDWMMPGMEGTELCRKAREKNSDPYVYIILLTAKGEQEDVLEGMRSGADDFVRKPFDKDELRVRVDVGRRVTDLQTALSIRVARLQKALDRIRTLEGFLPICAYCHKIRADQEAWEELEKYIEERSEAVMEHTVCPECEKAL
jgi:DNA-binding response OmpR family regulator